MSSVELYLSTCALRSECPDLGGGSTRTASLELIDGSYGK